MRPRYSRTKKIKTDYETQFPTDPILNGEIEKNIRFKKNLNQPGLTR